jgi:hypothetical protein
MPSVEEPQTADIAVVYVRHRQDIEDLFLILFVSPENQLPQFLEYHRMMIQMFHQDLRIGHFPNDGGRQTFIFYPVFDGHIIREHEFVSFGQSKPHVIVFIDQLFIEISDGLETFHFEQDGHSGNEVVGQQRFKDLALGVAGDISDLHEILVTWRAVFPDEIGIGVYGADVGTGGLQQLHLDVCFIREPYVIRSDGGYIFTVGSGKSFIQSGANAQVLFVDDELARTGIVGKPIFDQGNAVILRVIVDDDQLDIVILLLLYAFQGFEDILFKIVIDRYDGY